MVFAHVKEAARVALKHVGGTRRRRELAILLADDARLKALNLAFRRRNKTTNVLSFPATEGTDYLGDIAIAHGVATEEARARCITLADHAAHLAVHGVLHLLGYDHERACDARVMETLEVLILSELGIADPYAPRTRAA